MYCHTLSPGEDDVLTAWGGAHWESGFGSFPGSAHESLSIANFNLHPFPVININSECKSLSKFWEPL